MSARLDLNQQEKINKRYHDHPLFCACQATFRNYLAGMHYLMFSPTEVFVESVGVIDDLLEEGTDRLEYIRSLWQNLIIRYKLWPLMHPGAGDDKEYETAVSSVLYTVALAMSRHSDSYFNDIIKDALLAEIDSHTSVVKQQEDSVIASLSQYADGIEEWLCNYANSETYLSDDIDDVVHDRKPRSLLKIAHNNKNIDNKRKKAKNPKADYSKYSFALISKRKFKGRNSQLLEWLHDELKDKKFIVDFKDVIVDEELSQILDVDGKNKLVFNAVFSGADTEYHIVWTGTVKELGYFINQLEERGVLSWKEGPRKWQVTRNRIWQGKKELENDDETGKKHYTYIYEPFKENAFNGSLVPANTTKLDEILDLIAPPVEKTPQHKIDDEVEEEFMSLSNFEEENENNEGQKISEGYREISHRAKE